MNDKINEQLVTIQDNKLKFDQENTAIKEKYVKPSHGLEKTILYKKNKLDLEHVLRSTSLHNDKETL